MYAGFLFYAVITGSEKSALQEKGLFEPLLKVIAIISGNQGNRGPRSSWSYSIHNQETEREECEPVHSLFSSFYTL